jgi:hypothetical protein
VLIISFHNSWEWYLSELRYNFASKIPSPIALEILWEAESFNTSLVHRKCREYMTNWTKRHLESIKYGLHYHDRSIEGQPGVYCVVHHLTEFS